MRPVLIGGLVLMLVAVDQALAGGTCHGASRGFHGRSHFGPRVHFRPRYPYASFHHSYGSGIRRFHGLGEGAYCATSGVSRYHGLGDGYCQYYWWLDAPPIVVVVDGDRGADRPPEIAPAPAVQPRLTAPRSEQAWALLGRGEARAALRDFAVLALRSMDDAEPRLGYALAAAMLGRDETAVWAMRRAVTVDSASLGDLPPGAALQQRLRRLAEGYSSRARTPGAVEALFMTGALRYLLHEEQAAAALIAEAISQGDLEPSTRALHELLGAGATAWAKPNEGATALAEGHSRANGTPPMHAKRLTKKEPGRMPGN